MKNAASCEMQTAPDEDNEEKTAWAKFCGRHGVNPNLVMLKLTLFVMHGGETGGT